MVEIRKATKDDAAEVANVHVNSWKETYRGLMPEEFLKNLHLDFGKRYRMWQKILKEEAWATIVAECGEKGIVGFINGKSARDEKYNGMPEICSIYLLRHYHGQKIGYRLLKKYFETLSSQGFDRAYLWVLKNNPTAKFYERTGAVHNNDIKKAIIAGQEVKELCYVWEDLNI